MIFNGFYTITSPTGGHRTFQISTQSPRDSFAPGKRIISMLTGQDNEIDYTGFGFVNDDGIRIWAKYRGRSFYESCADMLWSMATQGESSPYHRKGVRMLLDKRCAKCNRKLTHPASIITGIGPECRKRK